MLLFYICTFPLFQINPSSSSSAFTSASCSASECQLSAPVFCETNMVYIFCILNLLGASEIPGQNRIFWSTQSIYKLRDLYGEKKKKEVWQFK